MHGRGNRNRQLGGDRDTIGDTEEITSDLIGLSVGMWDYIKNSGKFDADNWELEFLGFLAGRNISMTHMAMSSIRVMATCALLGQAVGTAASIADKYSLTPNGVLHEKIEELQQTLMINDCFLPYKKRHISKECTKNAAYKNLCNGEDRPNRIYNTDVCGEKIKNGTGICYDTDGCRVEAVHIVFDSDLDRETLSGDECERTHSTRCNVLLDSPDVFMPKTLCRSFKLNITDESGKLTTVSIENNRKRAYDIKIGKNISKIELIPETNWGGSEKTTVFSFDFR